MKRICMYCKKVYGYKKGKGETHGICKECLKKVDAELDRRINERNNR